MPAAQVAQPPPAAAWVLTAPSGTLETGLRRRSGRLRLTVERDGRVTLRADLGPVPPGRLRARRGRHHARFTTPSGKRRVHRLTGRTLTVRGRGGRGVELLAARDGVAFRALRPRPERTVLRAPSRTRAWLQAYQGDYERPYRGGRLASRRPGRYGFPALLRSHGAYTLLTESGAGRGAVSHLRLTGGGALRVDLPPDEPPPARTPWRVAVTGSIADVVGSDLPLALGRRSRIRDTSWIEPGRVAWSWWSDHRSATRPATQRQYVDAAAAAGWEYVTVDAGWDAAWVPELVRYAAERDVKVILWFDSKDLATRRQRRATLARVARWGVAGVKVDYLLSDDASRIARMEDIARAAAARRLVVDFHGCTIPRGLQRTWPNVLTLEGVLGAEHALQQPARPRDNVNLAFTRNVVGGMDFTPVTFSAPDRRTSDGHELAQSVVFESGLQHFADTPGNYDTRSLALEVLRAVPAAWDDTRLLAGAPDDHVVLARRDGARWFVAALSAGAPRTLTVPLGDLGAEGFDARVVTDGEGGLAATDSVASGTLTVPVARDGGFVAMLTPRG